VNENRTDHPVPADEAPQEAQRNLPHLLTELTSKAMDGSVQAAAGYAVKKGLDKVFGDRDPKTEDRKPGTEADPPPS
jgi:hypothetical protein